MKIWGAIYVVGLSSLLACVGHMGNTNSSAAADLGSAGLLRDGPSATYWVYVGAESADKIHRVRFGPDGADVEKTVTIGELLTETEGPHGLAISPDGKYLYASTAHGVPDGKLWKYELGPDTLVAAPIDLDRFPASLDVTPDGLYAFVVNFNLHGDMVPSSISTVFLPTFIEVAQTRTCTMPHGSRVNPDGTKLYSVCMMDDQLVELDTRTFEVARRFGLAQGVEAPLDRDDYGPHAGHDHHEMHSDHENMYEASCSPTWVQAAPTGDRVYVACNASDEVLEIDVDEWQLLRRFSTGRGPYNLEITPDGRVLVVTLKQGDGVEFFQLDSGEQRGHRSTSTTVTHGVVVSPDSRYAFISVEGVGAEPGKVDVFDLESLDMVASVEVRQQAAGIAFWRMEPESDS